MNTEWAVAKLEAYLHALKIYGDAANVHDGMSATRHKRVIDAEVAAKAVLREIDPQLAGHRFEYTAGWIDARDDTLRGLAILQNRQEIEENIGPLGPVIRADQLHPVVWGSASHLWDDGHFGSAVQRAATFLGAHLKDLVSREDVQDASLMQQTFSNSEPEIGKPRLRWPGDSSNLTVKSMNEGLKLFAPGVFLTIRNTSTHSTEEMSEHEALEKLAALSLLARWIDECELIEAPKMPDPSIPARTIVDH